MGTQEQLEWTVREYTIVTERLMELLAEADDDALPASIAGALSLLARAITAEWDGAQ